MVLRRHLFTNVCILFTVCLVILHVSELYNRTDLTLELNILILVFSLISFDFQILLSMRKATRAFWIRALVSSSVPHVLLILLPRYVKQSVSSSGFPPTVTRFLLFALAFIILVLFILMLSSVCADTRFSRSVFSCIRIRMRIRIIYLVIFQTQDTSAKTISGRCRRGHLEKYKVYSIHVCKNNSN